MVLSGILRQQFHISAWCQTIEALVIQSVYYLRPLDSWAPWYLVTSKPQRRLVKPLSNCPQARSLKPGALLHSVTTTCGCRAKHRVDVIEVVIHYKWHLFHYTQSSDPPNGQFSFKMFRLRAYLEPQYMSSLLIHVFSMPFLFLAAWECNSASC